MKLKKRLFIILLMLSATFLLNYQLKLQQQYKNGKLASQRVKKVISNKTDFRYHQPTTGEPIGEIKLAHLTNYMPIIEGEDLALSMGHGVGRIPIGILPGSKLKQQVILSGHRETFFFHLKDLKKGHIITIKMPYQTYQYKVVKTRIVRDNEASKVYKNGVLKHEELILMTCYPFNPFANPDRRYIVTADPINKKRTTN